MPIMTQGKFRKSHGMTHTKQLPAAAAATAAGLFRLLASTIVLNMES